MKALVVTPGRGLVKLVERPEPAIRSDREIKLQVIEVGICGTDRDEASGERGEAPAGQEELILGHEMLGRVVEAGRAVSGVHPGDYGLFTVRRECGRCAPCAEGRSDMCSSGQYRERGIKGIDGYQAEYVVDDEHYFVPVPAAIARFAVLTEPMSVAEKALEYAARIRAVRLPGDGRAANDLSGTTALVAGLGAVGILTAVALALRGAAVHGLDIVERTNLRATILERLGGLYLRGDDRSTGRHSGRFDLIFDASGVAPLELRLFDFLAPNGLYAILGIPEGDRKIELDAASIIRGVVLQNQVMLGSVNASAAHFRAAIDDLEAADQRWPGTLESIISERVPVAECRRALQRSPDEIKTVVEWVAP